MNFNLQPLLENDLVLLRPLKEEDFKPLFDVASDPLIWEQHQNKDRYTRESFTQFFNEAIASKGAMIIFDKKSNEVIGSSRFKIIDESEGVIEIGWSFLGKKYWGGHYNREFKKLMVNHALQSCKKVVFYVHRINFRSQGALAKLGAKKMMGGDAAWVLPMEKGITFVIQKEIQ